MLTPFRVAVSAKSVSEECLRHVPIVARFLKVAFHYGPLLWTLLIFFSLQYVAMT